MSDAQGADRLSTKCGELWETGPEARPLREVSLHRQRKLAALPRNASALSS